MEPWTKRQSNVIQWDANNKNIHDMVSSKCTGGGQPFGMNFFQMRHTIASPIIHLVVTQETNEESWRMISKGGKYRFTGKSIKF